MFTLMELLCSPFNCFKLSSISVKTEVTCTRMQGPLPRSPVPHKLTMAAYSWHMEAGG